MDVSGRGAGHQELMYEMGGYTSAFQGVLGDALCRDPMVTVADNLGIAARGHTEEDFRHSYL